MVKELDEMNFDNLNEDEVRIASILALVDLLIEKNIITEEEYENQFKLRLESASQNTEK
jgi:hypothetical protein